MRCSRRAFLSSLLGLVFSVPKPVQADTKPIDHRDFFIGLNQRPIDKDPKRWVNVKNPILEELYKFSKSYSVGFNSKLIEKEEINFEDIKQYLKDNCAYDDFEKILKGLTLFKISYPKWDSNDKDEFFYIVHSETPLKIRFEEGVNLITINRIDAPTVRSWKSSIIENRFPQKEGGKLPGGAMESALGILDQIPRGYWQINMQNKQNVSLELNEDGIPRVLNYFPASGDLKNREFIFLGSEDSPIPSNKPVVHDNRKIQIYLKPSQYKIFRDIPSD